VDLGKVAVEDDDVVGMHAGAEQRGGAVGRHVHRDAVAAQAARDGGRHARLVLGEEQTSRTGHRLQSAARRRDVAAVRAVSYGPPRGR
jgi:hypothetical protein